MTSFSFEQETHVINFLVYLVIDLIKTRIIDLGGRLRKYLFRLFLNRYCLSSRVFNQTKTHFFNIIYLAILIYSLNYKSDHVRLCIHKSSLHFRCHQIIVNAISILIKCKLLVLKSISNLNLYIKVL